MLQCIFNTFHFSLISDYIGSGRLSSLLSCASLSSENGSVERGGFPPFQGPLPRNPVFVVWFEGQRCEVAPPEPTAAAARCPQSLLSQAAPTPPYSVANPSLGELGWGTWASPHLLAAPLWWPRLIRRDLIRRDPHSSEGTHVWRRSDHFL